MKKFIACITLLMLFCIMSLVSWAYPTQASSISFSGITTTGMTVGFTRGSGQMRLVVVRQGSSNPTEPSGTNYTIYNNPTTVFSDHVVQTSTSTTSVVVMDGTGNTVQITGLSEGTQYTVEVFEYNPTGPDQGWSTGTATGNPRSVYTKPAAPIISTPSRIADQSFRANWTETGNWDYFVLQIGTDNPPTANLQEYTLDDPTLPLNIDPRFLNSYTKYYYRIKTYLGTTSSSDWSEVKDVTTLHSPSVTPLVTSITSPADVCVGQPYNYSTSCIDGQCYWQTLQYGVNISNSLETGTFSDDGIYYLRSFYGTESGYDVWSDYEASVYIKVHNAPTVSINIDGGSDYTTCTGTNLSIYSDVNGDGLDVSYQWKFNGYDISGKTSSILDFPSITTGNAGIYSLAVHDDCGTVTSNSATLGVQASPYITKFTASTANSTTEITGDRDYYLPGHSGTPDNYNTNLCIGESITLSVDVTGTLPLYYQWYKYETTDPISGETNRTLEIPSITTDDATIYACRVGQSPFDVPIFLPFDCGTYSTENIAIYAINVNLLPTPIITGALTACSGSETGYSTPYVSGHTYNWSVTAGTPASGTGNTIEVT